MAEEYDEDNIGGGVGIGVLEETDTEEDVSSIDTDDAERYAHWVDARKAVPGRRVVALCGKVWVPKHRADD
jgi:hypothetical protein